MARKKAPANKHQYVPIEERQEFLDVLAVTPAAGDSEALNRQAADSVALFNDAIRGNSPEQTALAELRYKAAVYRLNGDTFRGSSSVVKALGKDLSAVPGQVPGWGQGGEWLIEVNGMRIRVVSTHGPKTTIDLSFHVVDLGVPFLSSTGYRSHFTFADQWYGFELGAAVRKLLEHYLTEKDWKPVPVEAADRPWLGKQPAWLSQALAGVTSNGQLAMPIGGVLLPEVSTEKKVPLTNAERQRDFRRRQKEAREQAKSDGVQSIALTSIDRCVLSLGLLAHEDLDHRGPNWINDNKPGFDALLRKLWPENAGSYYLAEPKRSTYRPAEYLRAELAGQRVLIQRLEDENRRLRAALGEIVAELADVVVPPERPAPRARQRVGAPLESVNALGGVVDFELVSVGAPQALAPVEEQVEHRLFESPAAHEVVRLADKVSRHIRVGGWMTPATARARIAEWKAQTRLQATLRGNPNAGKVVLSLFDHTGNWSRPWEEAGYAVVCFDIQDNPELGDVNAFDVEFFTDYFGDFDGLEVYAILAACPCTEFATSGARHFAAKDADGRTDAAVQLVEQTKRVIEYYRPTIWSIENPVGRIEKLGGLPAWRLSFDPHHLGDPYTKKTLIWGRFNANLPIAPVEPVEGSKMHTKFGGSSQATKNGRSETPEGFAYGFFLANNAIDNPQFVVTCKYDRLSPQLLRGVVERGFSVEQIGDAISDAYYFELDDEAAESILRGMLQAGCAVTHNDQ